MMEKFFGAISVLFFLLLASQVDYDELALLLQQVPVAADAQDHYFVARVIDGDTIVVEKDGTQERVRLIGVNTPETKDPRKPVECFGEEAATFARTLLEGQFVDLQADPTQADRDRYNRLLRYVYLQDGTLVNEKLIAEGYAYEYTYETPYQQQIIFQFAEAQALASQKGLWGKGCELQ